MVQSNLSGVTVRAGGTVSGFVLDEHLDGRLTIAGRGAAAGTLVVRGERVSGRLGARRIDCGWRSTKDSLAQADETP